MATTVTKDNKSEKLDMRTRQDQRLWLKRTILVVVEQAVAVNVAQVPDQSKLVLLKASSDEDVASQLGRKIATLRSQSFEAAFQSIRGVLQRPNSI